MFVLAALGGGTTLAVLAIVAGVALVVAGLSGGARWLIAPALVLVLPLAIVTAADIRVDGGVGEREYRPASVAELRPSYELGMGELVVDMRDVDLPAGTTKLDLELGIGHAVVRVPEDACVSSDVQIGAGHAQVLDRVERRRSTSTSPRPPRPPATQPRLHDRRATSASARSRWCAATTRCPSNRDGWWDDRADLADRLPVRHGADRVSIVAGLAIGGLGVVLLLDRLGVYDLKFGYTLPAILACVGVILLAAGLDGGRR